jgi:lipopolysaccharide transport system permease protein
MNRGNPKQKLSFIYLRDVLSVLVARDFKVRYKQSMLGVAWSLLVPLAHLAVLHLVFTQLVNLNIPNYSSFLLTGILPWTWFQASLSQSCMTIVGNRDLVKQVGFPLGVLPPVTVLSQLVHFVLSLPILGVFLFMDGFKPSLAWLALPLVIGVQFILTLSLTFIFSALQVTFRDTQYLLGIFLFLWFYLTPVFWDAEGVSENWRFAAMANPLTTLLVAYRAILMRGEWPHFLPLGIIALFSSVVLGGVYLFFLDASHRFAEEM